MKIVKCHTLSSLYEKARNLDPLTAEEGLLLWEQAPLDELMAIAHQVRQRQVPGNAVTWQIDRNINISNICSCRCLFCNFHSASGQGGKPYLTTREEYREKIEELKALGGDQILLQGGLNPQLTLTFYEDLFRWLKNEFPWLRIHALGPPEVVFLSEQSGLRVHDVLQRLVDSGLSSLPGAGAEILSDRVRRLISPRKCSSEQWLGVMHIAHEMGLLTSATMMYGHIEYPQERFDHMVKIRELQAQCPEGHPGFKAFIAWPFQGVNTHLSATYPIVPVQSAEHLRLIALARLMLTNITHIQASWLTVGVPTAQLSLRGGADDMGSIMIEENVVRTAGSNNQLNSEGMVRAITEAGFTPLLRDQGYNPRVSVNV